jgi:hypothetical protein
MEYTLEKLEVYQQAEIFSDVIWNSPFFARTKIISPANFGAKIEF